MAGLGLEILLGLSVNILAVLGVSHKISSSFTEIKYSQKRAHELLEQIHKDNERQDKDIRHIQTFLVRRHDDFDI